MKLFILILFIMILFIMVLFIMTLFIMIVFIMILFIRVLFIICSAVYDGTERSIELDVPPNYNIVYNFPSAWIGEKFVNWMCFQKFIRASAGCINPMNSILSHFLLSQL